MTEQIYRARITFTDADGIKIEKGQTLGKLLLLGDGKWNTVLNGRVTAVKNRDWREYLEISDEE